ncbi:hypothetical protein COT50_01065 [candidate division WWE3 bacterium CG08_land_8_20_14_0_20_41_10]|uniref:O-antigen ligase-related domain-containing protein n=1 Tax=candidate division WWE3 bacterium CG08_land_8_20_14_0_20_41_10 TaxID=1975085 RepID=A0A2H0XCR0_UNCKA|nr:MAG: hypothetical protein COT50_01065 [candidate division WWE3 bacterium CG08_land_8_20_14_0_20_41_10]
MHQDKLARLLFPLFALCLFSLSLGQFSVIYKFNEGSIYLFDILIAVFDFIGILYLLAMKKVIKIPLPIFFLIAFCALGAISLIFTPLNLEPTEFLTSASYLMRFFSYVLFALVTWNLVKLRIFQVDKIHLIIIFTGLVLFVIGLFQLAVLPDLETLDPLLGWDPHKNRMASTFFDPNFLGMYFTICLAVSTGMRSVIARTGATKQSLFGRRLYPLSSLIFLAGIFLTFSRSAWLATSVLLFFTLLRKKLLLLVSLAIVLLAIFAVPRVQTRISGITDPQDSASFRLISWQNTWEIAKDNWVFGVGYNAFRYAQKEYGFLNDSSLIARSGAGSDSSLLLVLATTGVFGLIFFAGFFIVVLMRTVKTRDVITVGLISALTIDSLFINSLFYPQIIIVALVVLTCNSRTYSAK